MADPGTAGPASQLLRSAVQLFGNLLEAAQTRAELLTTEVEEEIQRVARLLLLGFAALLAGILGALIAGFVVVILFWDTHRVAAALAVLGVFLLAAAICGLAVRRELRARPRLFEATRTESDRLHLSRALELAEKGRGRVSPNPVVGCVIARDREVLGEGWHAEVGGLHAERAALADAATRGNEPEPRRCHGRVAIQGFITTLMHWSSFSLKIS